MALIFFLVHVKFESLNSLYEYMNICIINLIFEVLYMYYIWLCIFFSDAGFSKNKYNIAKCLAYMYMYKVHSAENANLKNPCYLVEKSDSAKYHMVNIR